MLKRVVYFVASLALLTSCDQEESITPREYPFIESLGISDIDETGATIKFEVLNAGKNSIESYGIQYFDSELAGNNFPEKEYFFQEINQSPENTLISFRIKYDLQRGLNYLVRPYVKSNGITVYGEFMNFGSRGVKAPEISEVSISKINGSTQFTISGDFFSSYIELNQVEIPGLTGYFTIKILKATNQELTIDLERTSNPFTLTENSFDLVVSSLGKSTVLPEHFTFGYPKLVSLSKMSGHVGEEIIVTIDQSYEYDINLAMNNYPSENYSLIPLEKVDSTTYKGVLANYPPGDYKISMVGNDFIDVFPDNFNLIDSWKLMTEDIGLSDQVGYQRIPAGNHLVFWSSDINANYVWNPETQSLIELPEFPGARADRMGVMLYGTSKGELYVGLGYKILTSSVQPFLDLWKLDLETFQWTRMQDLPLTHGFLLRFFDYQGKIMAVSTIEDKYLILDPTLRTWSKSPYDVPEFFMSTSLAWVHQEYIYYLQEATSYLIIKRFRIGEEPSVFGEFPSITSEGTGGMIIAGDSFYLKRYDQYFSINLNNKEIRNYQSIFQFGSFPPSLWGATEGELYTLPFKMNYGSEGEMIYQLTVQD